MIMPAANNFLAFYADMCFGFQHQNRAFDGIESNARLSALEDLYLLVCLNTMLLQNSYEQSIFYLELCAEFLDFFQKRKIRQKRVCKLAILFSFFEK